MKQITSFTINHDFLKRGMYISRVDGDVITYDIRMKLPNNAEGDYLEDFALHTLEHLFATGIPPLRIRSSTLAPWDAAPAFIF